MVWRAFPPEERSKAAGIMVVPAAAAPASGPVVGGFLVEYASWEWIFLLNVPIGAVALLIAARYLVEHTEPAAGSFDVPGFLLSAAGLASILYALAEAGERGFDDGRVLAFGAAGLALIAAFVATELRTAQPMLDVRIYRDALFRACNFAWLVTMFGGSSMIFLLTLELQTARGLSALESGLTTFPMAIGVMMIAQPASRLYRIIGPRRMIGIGLVVCAAITLFFARADADTNQWALRGLMLARGLGFGFVLVPLQAATYATVAPSDTGRATALYNAASQVASSLGVAVAATALTNRLSAHEAGALGASSGTAVFNAFQDVFLLVGLLSLAGAAVALLISDRAAAHTMRPDDAPVVVGGGD
jgi:EmrB/QacA subfamily drug resistance transporter